MQRILVILLLALPLLAYLLYTSWQQPPHDGEAAAEAPVLIPKDAADGALNERPGNDLPEKAVLDISVHTIDELKVVLDRAESLAMAPQPPGKTASIVLVLHGPEVEFFAIRNYDKYRKIVDQAARLDAFDVVDVRICQSMMEIKGIPRDDIPSFIEQVSLGPAEVERLMGEGYVYF